MQRIFCNLFITTVLISILSGCGSLSNSNNTSKPWNYSKLPDFTLEKSVGLDDISIAAISLIGTPYQWGGNNPQGGFDCSGLIVYVYNKAAGIKLPRTIQLMSSQGRSIDGQLPAPGDLVFFNTTGEKYSHAGIYVGQGRFVHAPSAGGTVRLDYITSPYWAAKFTEARRIASR